MFIKILCMIGIMAVIGFLKWIFNGCKFPKYENVGLGMVIYELFIGLPLYFYLLWLLVGKIVD